MKTIASDRDVTGGTGRLLNTHSGKELVWRLVQVGIISEDVLSEESASSALNLYDSDGDNSENEQDAGPRPYQFEPRRVWRND